MFPLVVNEPSLLRLADEALASNKMIGLFSVRPTGSDEIDGTTVAEVLATAERRYGSGFSRVLPTCKVWVNGNDAGPDTAVGPYDEVAVLPPVSGGTT